MSEKPTDLFGTISIAKDDESAETPAAPAAEPRKQRRKSRPAASPKKKDSPKKLRSSGGGGRLLRVWIGVVLLVVSAYSAAGFFLTPYLVRTLLPSYFQEQTATLLSFQEVRFNPFTFRLELDGTAVHTQDGEQAGERLLGINRLDADLRPLPLLRGDLVCDSLSIDRLHLSIVRQADKTYNIAPLLRGRAMHSQGEIIDFAELPFLFALNNISIGNSRVAIEDRHTGKEHLIDHIEVTLPAISNFAYQARSYLQPRFSAVVNGSPVTFSGEAGIGGTDPDGETQFSVNLNDIDIPLYTEYLPVELPIEFTDGTANGTLQVSFSELPGQGNRLIIQFDLSTTGLIIQSRDATLSMAVPSARLEGIFEPLSRSLQLHNVLLREPAITSSGQLSRETLAALLPMTRRPGGDTTLSQIIPGLRITLLIADDAGFSSTRSGEDELAHNWKDIQLSIRNFSNETTSTAAEAGSFRISGEDALSTASFTWQGGFADANQPSGNLQLVNMPVARIAPFLGRTADDISGTVDATGLLSFALADRQDRVLDYDLRETTLTIKELQLKEKGVVWLRTPSLRCEPVSRVAGVTDLGNVFLPNSTAVMDRDQLPHLFGLFASRPDEFRLHGFDFSGTVKILDNNDKDGMLNLQEVVFQANKLEQKEIKEDNFVFSARQGTNGSIKAKGILQIAPVTLSAQLGLSDLEPRQLLSWFTESKTLLTSRAQVSATGVFRYPQQEFTGEISGRKVVVGGAENPVLQAEKLDFNSFSWSADKHRLEIETILVDQPAFSWQRQTEDENPAESAAVFLRQLLLPESAATAEAQSDGDAGFSLAIGRIEWSDGAVAYHDQRLSQPLQLDLTDINGRLSELIYPAGEQNSAFGLRGTVDGRPFSVEGEGRLLQKPASVTAGFVASSLPLRLFAPQIEQRIRDIAIDRATAQVSYSATWQGERSREQADIVIRGATPKQTGSPAAVALALISDGDGQIRYRSDLNQSSGTGVLTEAITHYATLLIKAVVNPLLVVSDGNFGDLVEQQYVTFQPGTTVLTGSGRERLSRYSELLAAHPLIALRVIGYADRSADSPVLLEELTREEQQRVDEENRRRSEQWRQQQEELLAERRQRAAATGQPIQEIDIEPTDDTFIPAVPRPVSVPEDQLVALITGREQVVMQHLVEQLGIDAGRVAADSGDNRQILEDGNGARADLVVIDDFDRVPREEEQ